jgi:uncharacterized protein (TIGR00369 family)
MPIESLSPEQACARVRASFAKQSFMTTLGATLARVAPGEVEIAMPVASHISQQHGFVHAGAVSSIADSACGYAALSLMAPGVGVLTAEFKINLVAPAAGEHLLAKGRVLKAGRTLTLAMAEVFAITGDSRKLCAVMTATCMSVAGRDGVAD